MRFAAAESPALTRSIQWLTLVSFDIQIGRSEFLTPAQTGARYQPIQSRNSPTITPAPTIAQRRPSCQSPRFAILSVAWRLCVDIFTSISKAFRHRSHESLQITHQEAIGFVTRPEISGPSSMAMRRLFAASLRRRLVRVIRNGGTPLRGNGE